MNGKVFFVTLLLILTGCGPKYPKHIPNLKNGSLVLVKVSNTKAVIVSFQQENADLGDLYCVRYVGITGELRSAFLREWEFQLLDENYEK